MDDGIQSGGLGAKPHDGNKPSPLEMAEQRQLKVLLLGVQEMQIALFLNCVLPSNSIPLMRQKPNLRGAGASSVSDLAIGRVPRPLEGRLPDLVSIFSELSWPGRPPLRCRPVAAEASLFLAHPSALASACLLPAT